MSQTSQCPSSSTSTSSGIANSSLSPPTSVPINQSHSNIGYSTPNPGTSDQSNSNNSSSSPAGQATVSESQSSQSSQSTTNTDSSLPAFFLKYLEQSVKSKSTPAKRGRRVASLGESLTAEEALEIQKKQEEEKRRKELEKEERKLQRLKKNEEKLKQKSKGKKRKEKQPARSSSRPKKIKYNDDQDVCGECGNIWEEETEESETWIECKICKQWYHAACIGLEQEELEDIGDYICESCN